MIERYIEGWVDRLTYSIYLHLLYRHMYVYKTCLWQQCIHSILAPSRHTFAIMSLRVNMERAETDVGGLFPKQIVEPYGGVDLGRIALDDLYRKASQMPDYRPEHDDYQAFHLFLGHLANAITLILDAQNTGQLFCAGVYADFFVEIKVEIETLLPHLKTLLDCFGDCSEIVPAAIVVYKWLVKPSGLRLLLKFLARGRAKAFCVAINNDNMMRAYISTHNITEGEFVETSVEALLGERLSKLRKIDYILGAR